MPRQKVVLSDIYPYHIYARSNNKDWFEIPLKTVFGIYANIMEETIERYGIECHAFVLMANHYHMLVSTPNKNLSSAMRYFMTETSRAIARCSSRINRIYGARYSWTLIKTAEHYAHAYCYVYRNPIKHGAVEYNLDEYKWSTLYPFHKKFNALIVENKEKYHEYIPSERKKLLDWLHRNNDEFYLESVRKALRKHCFIFGQDKNSGKRYVFTDMLHPKKSPGT